MKLKNSRLFPCAAMFGKTLEGATFLAVIIKGTFRLENTGEPARLAPAQLPIFTADEPYDPKNPAGPLKFESDMVPFKPRTDVILVGHAYAPYGRPARVVDVEIEVGPVRKKLRVFGDRAWSFPSETADAIPYVVGPAEFVMMPLTWDRAFGGIDKAAPMRPGNPPSKPWCERNYMGRGFCGARTVSSIHNTPLPNIEDPEDLIRTWDSNPRPAGCGFFPRNSRPRLDWYGTFDEKWKAERPNQLPLDYRFESNNGADLSMQAGPYLRGNERIALSGVRGDSPRLVTSLPGVLPRVRARLHAENVELATHLDSLVMVPDEARFYILWRSTFAVADELASNVEGIAIEYDTLDAQAPSPLAIGGAA